MPDMRPNEMLDAVFADSAQKLGAIAEKAGEVLNRVSATLLNPPGLSQAKSRWFNQFIDSKPQDKTKPDAEHPRPMDAFVINWPQSLINPAKLQEATKPADQNKPADQTKTKESKTAPESRKASLRQQRQQRDKPKLSRFGTGFEAFKNGQTLGHRMRGGKVLGKALGGRGSFGKVLGGIGSTVPVIGSFASALKAGIKAADAFAEGQVEAMKKFSRASPVMAMAFNRAEQAEFFHQMRMGTELGQSTSNMLESRTRARKASEPIETWFDKKLNWFADAWYTVKADVLEFGNDLFGDSDEEKKRKAQEKEDKLNNSVKDLSRRMGLTGDQIDNLKEQLKITAKAEEQGGFTFGQVAEAMARNGKDAHEKAKERVRDMKGNKRGGNGSIWDRGPGYTGSGGGGGDF